MKKFFAILLALVLAFTSVSCGVTPPVESPDVGEGVAGLDPGTEVTEPAASEKPAATPKPTETPAETTAPAATPKPQVGGSGSTGGNSGSTATPQPTKTPSAPTPTPTPAAHTHSWVEITEQVKVVDQPATEGHFEGGSYTVVICRCGAEFTSGEAWIAHTNSFDSDTQFTFHGGNTIGQRSNQIWVEGTAEVSHYETRVTGYRCSTCGATK